MAFFKLCSNISELYFAAQVRNRAAEKPQFFIALTTLPHSPSNPWQ